MSETTEARWEQHNEAGCRYFGQGAYAEAEQEFVAAIREATVLGSESVRLASSLSNLGQLKYRQRDFGEAEQLFRRSLAIRERALGSDHYGVVQSVNNLAMLHYTRGELSAAEPLFRRALALSDRHLGSDHPDVATALSNLARLYFRQSDYAAAAPLLSRLLSLKEAERGASHPEVAAILASLAKVRVAQQHYEAAEPLARRALAVREYTSAPDDPVLATSLHLLAEICAARGNHDEERRLRDRERAIREGASVNAEPAAGGRSLESIAFVHGTEPIAPPVLERATPAAPPPPAPLPPQAPPLVLQPFPDSVLPVGAVTPREPMASSTGHPPATPGMHARERPATESHHVEHRPSATQPRARARTTHVTGASRVPSARRPRLLGPLIKLGVVIALLLTGVWLMMGHPPLHTMLASLDRSVGERLPAHANSVPQH